MIQSQVDSRDGSSALLPFLRSGAKACSDLHIADWFGLCQELKRHGLLSVSADELASESPSPVARKLAAYTEGHRRRMAKRLHALNEFADEAERQSLHFIIIKGMALSSVLYGDAFARQSGDIDILVAADDVLKADYVARASGWQQPGEAFRARRMLDAGTLDAAALERMHAPYALRSNEILPHVTNYYFAHCDGQVDSLEIHDRFHRLTAEAARDLLWDVRKIELGGRIYLTCGDAATLMISALSMHEDVETVRANTSTRSTMGLKACFDVHSWLSRMQGRDGDQSSCVRDLLKRFGVERAIGTVLGDVCEVFPDDRQAAACVGGPCPSVWEMPYLERIADVSICARNGVRTLGQSLARFASTDAAMEYRIDTWEAWKALSAPGQRHPTSVLAQAIPTDGGIHIGWEIPSALAFMEDRTVFQAIVLNARDDGVSVGVRANAFCEDGTWQARLQIMGADTIDGHANKMPRGELVPVKMEFAESDALRIGMSIPLPQMARQAPQEMPLVLLSAWEQLYGQLYRRFAGEDFAFFAEDIMQMEKNMTDYADYLPELRKTTLFRDMDDDEIISLLKAMQPPIKSGKLQPPADGSPHTCFRMVLRTQPPREIPPRRFKYDGQPFGVPGMLMGEVLVFSCKEEYIKPTPLNIKPPLPEIDFEMETLEFTPEMLTRFYGVSVSAAQGKMLRNLLGMQAQKVVDIRRNLFLERGGYDIYADENLVR